MARRGETLTLALLLLATAAWFPSIPAVSAAGPPFVVWFPWVPNGESIGGQGPWQSELSFQNLSDNACAMSVFIGSYNSWSNDSQVSLRGNESRPFSGSSLGVPPPGAPMRLESTCPIVATLKQVTPSVSHAPWSDGAHIVTGYTGVGQTEVAAARATATSAWHLPIAQTNSGWNTFIRVANLSLASDADVTVELYPSGNVDGASGATMTLTRRLGIGGVWTIDAQASLGLADWVGQARVSSSGALGVIANRVKPSTAMALTNVAVAADGAANAPQQRTLAPLLFNAYNGWNTGINMANVSDRPADVTVQYFTADGAMARHDMLTIAPRGMQYVYTPGNAQADSFVGSAAILSDATVVAAIDEVKYETTEALSYMASGAGQQDAALPVLFREDPNNGRHDNSGINIANLDPDREQIVTIELLSGGGENLTDAPILVTLPPGGNSFLYVPFIADFPPGAVASARLRSQNATGFVAISNDVNYGVSGDGSVVFSASSPDGYYLAPGAVGQ